SRRRERRGVDRELAREFTVRHGLQRLQCRQMDPPARTVKFVPLPWHWRPRYWSLPMGTNTRRVGPPPQRCPAPVERPCKVRGSPSIAFFTGNTAGQDGNRRPDRDCSSAVCCCLSTTSE